MNLANYSDLQLRAEIERREQIAKIPAPTVQTNIDITPVIDLVVSWVTRLADGKHNDDIKDYVFEAAVTAVYGMDAWKWINAVQR